MLNWDILINGAGLASVVPREYDRFLRPVADGLAIVRRVPEWAT